MENNGDLEEKLHSLLQTMHDWEKTPTNVPGVRIIKIPPKGETTPRLGIEINPVDNLGRAIKKTGAIVITNLELFDMYKHLFSNLKVIELMEEIENIRLTQTGKDSQTSEDQIFNI